MCTAMKLTAAGEYFGRTLDLEYSYDERVTVIPRSFLFEFRNIKPLDNHFAIIGMSTVVSEYPLLYDATNEHGLSMSGLNFPNNACYFDKKPEKQNVAAFEFIPYILGSCKTLKEAMQALLNINITNDAFSAELKPAPLHWIIADAKGAVTVEQTSAGLRVYENKVGVLTNNPPFYYHITNLNNYMGLSAYPAQNRMCEGGELASYCSGMGAIGLPGDNSSASRFVRTVFLKENALPMEEDSVGMFFRIMSGVEQTKGTVRLENGKDVISVYTSCCDCEKGIYYYKTYEGGFGAVDMHKENLDGDTLSLFELIKKPNISYQN